MSISLQQVAELESRFRPRGFPASSRNFLRAGQRRACEFRLDEEARLGHPGVEYVVQCDDSSVAPVDTDRIAQVINNLISNARHHGNAGAPIEIEVRAVADALHITVRNAGEPIDPSLVPHLFSAFRRGTVRNERNPTGLGLGLHISQQIAHAHGGRIVYEPCAPHVIFRVEIPRQG